MALRLPARGARIELTGLMDDPNPLPVGATGKVTRVNDFQIGVDWEAPYEDRSLMLVPEDPFRVIG